MIYDGKPDGDYLREEQEIKARIAEVDALADAAYVALVASEMSDYDAMAHMNCFSSYRLALRQRLDESKRAHGEML